MIYPYAYLPVENMVEVSQTSWCKTFIHVVAWHLSQMTTNRHPNE